MAGGLGLLLYPSVADYWNSFHQSRAIASYQETVDNLSREEYEKLWNEAVEWNKKLAANYTGPYTLTDSEMAEYNSILDVTGMLRRTFPVEGILLDNGKQVCSVEVNAPGWATGAVGYHIFTRAINVW